MKIRYSQFYGFKTLILIGKIKDEDLDLTTIDLVTIFAATYNFSPTNIIGSGGFGLVYKVIFFFHKNLLVIVKYIFLFQQAGEALSRIRNCSEETIK